ncbi:DNA alkylation repair protein [Marinoscillum sp.]|uniref:DNA alkylation repair protein n=1 Tax=Marinoscillum sp. TaxID=2024838 RepID=UPI003BA85036
MNDLAELRKVFTENANASVASQQQAYLKNKFEHFGIKSPIRREITKPFLTKDNLSEQSELTEIIQSLWNQPEREFQAFGLDLSSKYVRRLDASCINLFEYMTVHKSWWDTVDFIATNLMGPYFKKYPDQLPVRTEKWLQSENIWLQRCAILYQLKWRNDLDTERLTKTIQRLKDTKEFFLNKAIGWILREYSKTNPEWVLHFVNTTELNSLSKREALRLIK